MALLDITNSNTKNILYVDRPNVSSVEGIVSKGTNSTELKLAASGPTVKVGGRILII